ncbi:MAG: YicC family protein [Firmicutes bacterium]|nr:YicC family protein [Bacillota bacterium]
MVRSMTGFGRGEAIVNDCHVVVELKALNHRYQEVVFRLPRALAPLEERLRRLVRERVLRGRVEGTLSVGAGGMKIQQVRVEPALAGAYYRAIRELQALLGLDGRVGLEHLISLPGVLSLEEGTDAEVWWPAAERAAALAVDSLVAAKEAEGERLAEDIRWRIRQVERLGEEIAARAPAVVEEYRARLNRRLREWLEGGAIDEDRLAAEVAIFAERCDVTEETVRLRSHVAQFLATMEGQGPVGRQLDFLLQEMLREVNTVGAKAGDLAVRRAVLLAKGELERIREQVQNLE